MATSSNGTQQLEFEELFLTKKEHLEIRTLSQILARSEDLKGYSTSQPVDEVCPSPQHKILQSFHQVIDPGTSGDIALLRGVHRVESLDLLAAMSDDTRTSPVSIPKDERGLDDQQHDPSRITCAVRTECYRAPLDFTRKPLESYIALLEQYDYKIPFALTASLTLLLMKHGQTLTTEYSREKAYCEFATFATCSGLDQLSARFDLGATSRNFLQYINLIDENEGVYATSGSLKSSEADCKLSGDLSPSTAWTQPQRTLLRMLSREQLLEWNEFYQHSSFDRGCRRFLYNLLSTLVRSFRDKLHHARLCRPSRERTTTFSLPFYRYALGGLAVAGELLSLFVGYFNKEIRLTLKWVAHVCKLRNTTYVLPQSPPGDVTPLEDLEKSPGSG